MPPRRLNLFDISNEITVRKKKTYDAAIIGLGNIGWKFDISNRKLSTSPLSHAGTYAANPTTNLVGGYSIEKNDCREFERHFDSRTYQSIKDLLWKAKPDIVSICSPNEYHFEHLSQCLEAGVPMIWLEKPPAINTEELKRLIKKKESLKDRSKVLINYQRRYIRRYQTFRKIYQDQLLGENLILQMTYSRGLLLNGCHLVDLSFFITDDSQEAILHSVIAERDPKNPSFTYRFSSGLSVSVSGADVNYSLGDVVLICENGRVGILQGGRQAVWEDKVENNLYPGFYRLESTNGNMFGSGEMESGFLSALGDLIRSYENDTEPQSNLLSALHSQRLIQQVMHEI